MMILTKRQEFTTDKEEVEKDVKVDIIANHVQKQTASLALGGK